MRRSACLASFLLLAATPALADAERPKPRRGYKSIRPPYASLLERGPDAVKGHKFTVVYLKFNGVRKGLLRVWGGVSEDGKERASLLRGRLRVKRKLAQRLKGKSPKDSFGKKLTIRRSNIQVYGTALVQRGKVYLLVDRVRRLESFRSMFERERAALGDGSPGDLLKLIRRIRRTVRYFPSDAGTTTGLVGSLRKTALEKVTAKLPALPGGAAAWIEAGLRHESIELVSQVWSHPEVSEEHKTQANAALRKELNARAYLGQWRSYPDLKRALGFEKSTARFRKPPFDFSKPRWVPKELVWLAAASLREKDRIRNKEPRRPVPKGLLQQGAESGKIARGMDKNMVYVACKKRLGADGAFPARVERFRERSSDGKSEWVFELWVMKNGERVFFFNNLVTEAPSKG